MPHCPARQLAADEMVDMALCSEVTVNSSSQSTALAIAFYLARRRHDLAL